MAEAVYKELLDRCRNRIMSGGVRPGELLGSEKEMARSSGIARADGAGRSV